MNGKKISGRTLKLTQMAILFAIMLLMAFTPLGFFKTAGVEISFLMIPVVVGAIVMGPVAGLILGAFFGLLSFIQCFGFSFFGGTLLGINPYFTFILCMIPRLLMGWLTGLIFKGLYRIDKTKWISFGVASLSGALLNTIFFVGGLFLLFGRTEFIMGLRGGMNLIAFAAAFVGTNGVIEAIVCFVVGTALSKVLVHFLPSQQRAAQTAEKKGG